MKARKPAQRVRALLVLYVLITLSLWIYLFDLLVEYQLANLFVVITGLLSVPYWILIGIRLTYRYPRIYTRYHRLKANGGSHTTEQWLRVLVQQGYRCACCQQVKPLTKDHIIPVALGGSDNISNIQALCQSCNASKGTKIIDYR